MASIEKSRIALIVAKIFDNKNQLGTSFFFKKNKNDCSITCKFFINITANLMTHIPELISSIITKIDANPAIFEKALEDQFEKLVF